MADLTLQHLAVGEGEASQMHCAMFTTSALPVTRPEDLSTHRGHFPKRDFFVPLLPPTSPGCVFFTCANWRGWQGSIRSSYGAKISMCYAEFLASRVLRTVRLRACGVQGFCKNAAPAVILEFNETDSAT